MIVTKQQIDDAESYDSVWDAIADTPEEANIMKLKSSIMIELNQYISKYGWTKQEVASYFNIDEFSAYNLINGKISKFTVSDFEKMKSSALRSMLKIEQEKYAKYLTENQVSLGPEIEAAWADNLEFLIE